MPGLADLIDKKKNVGVECQIQLNMGVNFFSIDDTGNTRTFYVLSDNEEIRLDNEAPKIVAEFTKSFLDNYQKKEKVLRNESNSILDKGYLLSVCIHKINLKKGKLYIEYPNWIFNKRATINPKTKDNKCFQYSTTVALNHQNIENHSERISNIKPFDNYNWKDIDFPAGIKDWEKFKKIIKMLLLISYMHHLIKK